MPRGKRAEVAVEEELVASPEAEGQEETTPEVEEAPKSEKGAKFSVTASYKTRTIDGDRISHKYRGDGATLVAAIADVKGADEDIADEYGRPFPKGISINVNVTIKKGDYAMERSVAPQTARAILDAANVELATRLFGL